MHPALEHVPPALLLPVENDLRERNTPDYLDYFHNRLVPDVRERGVQVPVIAYREGGKLRVMDGETRRLAAVLAGQGSLPALIHEEKPNEADLKRAQLLANTMRRDMQLLELAAVYSDLMRINGWTQADLARAVHVSAAQVAKVLAISGNLLPEVQELVAAGKLPPRAAYALSRLPMPQQMELATKAVNMCVEAVEARVTAMLGKKQPKAKPVKFSACGITGTIKGNPLEALRALHAKIAEVLKRIERDPALTDVLLSLLKGT